MGTKYLLRIPLAEMHVPVLIGDALYQECDASESYIMILSRADLCITKYYYLQDTGDQVSPSTGKLVYHANWVAP